MRRKKTQTFDAIDEVLGGGVLVVNSCAVSMGPGVGKSDMILEFMKNAPPGTPVVTLAHQQLKDEA